MTNNGRCRAARIALHPFQFQLFTSDGSAEELTSTFQDLEPGAKLYVLSMYKFERRILQQFHANDLLLREAIGLDSHPTPLSPNLGKQHYLLCNAISAYRLVEELANMSNVHPTSVAIPCPRRACDETLPHFGKLHDVKALISNFCKTINGMPNFQLEKPEKAGPLAHLRTLSKLKNASNAVQVLINLAVASLHLGYILETPFDGELPDLPDSSDSYFAALQCNLQMPESLDILDEVELQKTIYYEGSVEPGKTNLRSCLQLALMISPLYLLIPNKLHSKRWNRKDMIKVAQSLGNARPPELIKVERLILKTVYSIARRELDVCSAALHLAKGLSEVCMEFDDSSISSWFNLTGLPDLSANISVADNVQLEILSDTVNGLDKPDSDTSADAQTVAPQPYPSFQDHVSVYGAGVKEKKSATVNGNSGLSSQEEYRQRILGLQPSAVQRSMDREASGEVGNKNEAGAKMLVYHDEDGEDEIQDEEDDEDEIDVEEDLPKKSVGFQRKTAVSFRTVHRKDVRKRTRDPNVSEEESSLHPPTDTRIKRHDRKQPSTKSIVPPATKRRKTTRCDDVPLKEVIEIDYDSQSDQEKVADHQNQLKLDPIPILRSEKIFNLYGPTEESIISFSPIAHCETDLNNQEQFLQAVVESYSDGRPLHLANPDKSAFRHLSAAEFEKTSVEELLHKFSTQNLVVHGLDVKGRPEFNEAGFYSLVPSLEDVIDIQDQSIQPKNGNYNKRLKQGTCRQILEAHRQSSKILNALNFPGTRLLWPDLPLSSDLIAWEATRHRKMSSGEGYPVSDMSWYLGATKGAGHWWHIDSNGTATFIFPDSGAKIWIAGYKIDNNNEESFSDIRLFLPPFDITKVCKEKWRLEAVVLSPGSRLLMRPNTPHAVFTIDSAICRGGHFYAITTMQQTAASMMHSFMTGSVTTNTNHDQSRPLLRRMAELCYLVFVRKKLLDNHCVLAHVPRLDNLEGVLNLLSLCNLVIFANVLDGRTYLGWQQDPSRPQKITQKEIRDMQVYDRNVLTLNERLKYRHARGMCLQILFWFAASFSITTKGSTGEPVQVDDVLNYLVYPYLVQQGRALLAYKRMADQQEIAGFPGCTMEKLLTQLDAIFSLNETLRQKWISSAHDDLDEAKYTNLLWSGPNDLTFKQRDTIDPSAEKIFDFSQGGMTTLDRCFLEGYATGFKEEC